MVTVLAETTAERAIELRLCVSGTVMTIALHGPENSRVAVETTADAARGPWTAVASVDLDAQGTGRWEARTERQDPARFYRARH